MTYLNSEISLHYCWIKSLKIWYSEFILQIKVYYWHRPVIQCSDSPALLYRSCRIKKVPSSTIQKLPHQKKSPALLYRSCRIKKAASKKKGVNFAAHRTSEMNYRFEQSIQFLKSSKHKLNKLSHQDPSRLYFLHLSPILVYSR